MDLGQLSAAQRAAVTQDADVPLQILAGPGSGKTRVLTMRVAWLVHGGAQREPVRPERCVVVTFTNKAAREMRERLQVLIGADTDKLVLGISRAWQKILTCQAPFTPPVPNICGATGIGSVSTTTSRSAITMTCACHVLRMADHRKRLLRDVLNAHSEALLSQGLQLKVEQAQATISRAKAQSLDPATFRMRGPKQGPGKSALSADFHVALASVYDDYQSQLRQNNALDFDDLLLYGMRLLREHPDVVRDVEHVLVDEFQDTNAVQYELMTRFAAAKGHISIVGDPDQSIYGVWAPWRAC